MNHDYLTFLFRNGFCLLPAKGKGDAVEPKALAGMLRSFHTLGYTLDRKVVKHLSSCSVENVTAFYNQYYLLMKQEKGVLYPHKVFYPNFPEMEDMTDFDYWLRATLHYLTARKDDYGFMNQDLPAGKEYRSRAGSTECEILHGVSAKQAKKLLILEAKKSFEGKMAISEEKAKVLALIFKDYGKEIDIESIPFHENIGVYVNVLGGKKRFNEKMLSFASVPTDVLRVYAVLSEASPTLASPIKFISLPRGTRRILLSKLNAFAEKKGNICEDLARNEFLWKRALELLHPGEFSSQYPILAKQVHAFRNEEYETYYSSLEQAKPDQDRYLELLSRRPGEFARKLDATLRIVGYEPGKTLDAFAKVAKDIATPVLLSLWTFYQNRPGAQGRVFRFHTVFGYRVYGTTRGLPQMLESLRQQILSLIESALKEIYANRERIEKVYLSPTLKQYAVPTNARSANSANKTLTYGTRIDLKKDVRYLRCFTHWKNRPIENGRVDIDLSAEFFSEDFRRHKSLAWHNMAELNKFHCFHSGDFVTAPQGASEFIDLDLETLAPFYRYVAIVDTMYYGSDYASTPECFAGLAAISEKAYDKPREKKQRLNPATVKYKFDLTTKGCGEIICFVIDTKARQLIWADSAFESPLSQVAAGDIRVIGQVQDVLKARMNLYDFFKLHEGHVRFVDGPKDAKFFIGEEDEADLKPYFVQDIIAHWL